MLRYDEKSPADSGGRGTPEGGVSKQSIEETKTALRELGLKDDCDAGRCLLEKRITALSNAEKLDANLHC